MFLYYVYPEIIVLCQFPFLSLDCHQNLCSCDVSHKAGLSDREQARLRPRGVVAGYVVDTAYFSIYSISKTPVIISLSAMILEFHFPLSKTCRVVVVVVFVVSIVDLLVGNCAKSEPARQG